MQQEMKNKEQKEIIEKAKEVARRIDPMETITVDGKRYFHFAPLTELGLEHYFSSVDSNLKMSGRAESPELKQELEALYSLMSKPHKEYYFMFQVHSNRVDAADEAGLGEPFLFGRRINDGEGPDGLSTGRGDYMLSSSYGDCAPLLFFDPLKKAQANVHSGWKGTLYEIAASAIQGMVERYGSRPEDIHVAIGPHIGRDDFEVHADVADPFKECFPMIPDLVREHPTAEGKYLVDLNLCIAYVLLREGILPDHILNCGRSTVAHPEDFHSFRRDKEKFGLMMVISQMK